MINSHGKFPYKDQLTITKLYTLVVQLLLRQCSGPPGSGRPAVWLRPPSEQHCVLRRRAGGGAPRLRPSGGLAPASRRATLRAAAAGWLWGSGRLAPASRLAALRAAAAGRRRWVPGWLLHGWRATAAGLG